MKMLGHDYVAHNFKLVFAPDLFEDAEKYVPCMPGTEKRLPTITAAGDEMKIAEAVDPLQAAGHGAAL
jgi:hypothetical protein